MMRRTLRRWINGWIFWKAHRSLARALPGFAALDAADAEDRRRHRPGVRQRALKRKRLMTDALRMELTR